ncbi:YbaB/EbfC family nucleoid-associated protein [Saccharothrix sp. S26]|uniref:YbaB/EbfC family nucleoid-associated protein n=1 Tax=Saccharothrix sp. S26 TaxID=2907215 RepID=UPI001F457B7D|nr:YbaB/EbfC family nucleoid-associated protein [Saccharothrix sp. S26]MCE6995567.1 YbaB/EbfC family nucleoid-associated protein [Saccharothrix sp. S26]
MSVPGDLVGGDPAEVERGLDAWVATFERRAERYQQLQHRVDGVRISATSPNGVVTVTVDADGALVDAKFTDQLVRTTPDELSRQLLAAAKQAKAQITSRVREIAGDTLGEDGAERIAGYYAQKFAGPGEPEPRTEPSRRARTDHDDFGEDSVFDQS